MIKFFSYEKYAEWRDSGDNGDTPVKLVGEGCWHWQEMYEARAELATLRAENERLKHGMVDLAMTLNKTAEYQVAELMAENSALEQHASALRLAIRECIIHHGDYIGNQLFSDMYDLIGGEEALK